MSASSAKRCLYEVLGGLNRECTPDEIRSAYRKLALQRHPDKLVKSGISEAEATAQFQELVNAYEVLSDPRERAWYDSHRSQILFSDNINNKSSASGSSSGLPDLFSFFSNSVYNGYGDTGKGFFKVYAQVFDDIYRNEVNFAKKLGLAYPNEAPLLGNLDSPYVQVTAFFNYWLGFITIMDFCWVDQYDAMAGMNRKSRRMMEDENKKLRKKARRDYNDTVRGLAEFVKKRDKRVIDMQVKRKEEMEKKKEEEKKRKKELEKQKAERAMQYEEPEWAKIDEEEEEFEELVEDEDDEKKNELYCVVCGKKFKSDKQWKNHEQSKKHKEKVVELRRAFKKEDKANFEEFEEDGNGYLSEDNVVDEVINEFEDHKINDNTTQSESNQKDEDEDNDEDEDEEEEDNDEDEEEEEDEDEASMLEAMMKMKKNLNSKKPKASVQEVKVNDDDDEMEFMEYNNVKETRRNKNRRRKGKKLDVNEEDVSVNVSKTDEHENAEQNNTHEDVSNVDESPSDSQIENESDEKKEKLVKQTVDKVDKKVASKKENINQKNVKKGKKQKATSTKGNARLQKESSNECEKCGEEFESRNKLHRHLEDTGHAKLKHR